MKQFGLLVASAALLMAETSSLASADPQTSSAVGLQTIAGIPLNSDWRRQVYAHARDKLQHPAWGWRHSERDYLLAASIAKQERMAVDFDVLFAAAFLHDAGAIEPFAREGVDHAERSVELAESFLRNAGFPMQKFPAVRMAILAHMFDKQPDGSAEAIVLHDADTLDFLGATGVARRLALTGDAADMDAVLARAELFSKELPSRLLTRSAQRLGRERIRAMRIFFEQLQRETPGAAKL